MLPLLSWLPLTKVGFEKWPIIPKEILNNAPSSRLKLPLPMVAMTTSLILIGHYQAIVGGLYNTYKLSQSIKPHQARPSLTRVPYREGGIPAPPPPEIFQLSIVSIVTGMKQQSCPRLHQKQSEDLNSKIFRWRGGHAPRPPSRQARLLVCHMLLSSRYHPLPLPNSKSSRYHPLPPPPPPPPPSNSKSSRYHPLPPQLKIIPLPPSFLLPTQNPVWNPAHLPEFSGGWEMACLDRLGHMSGECHSHALCSNICNRTQSTVNSQSPKQV